MTRFLHKALSYGIKGEVLMLTFSAGVIVGYIVMAVLITAPRILGMLIMAGLR